MWGPNNSTVIFSGDSFWRFNETTQKVVEGYPSKTILAWKKVEKFDTAFKKDGITYFFKGLYFYEFNDNELELQESSKVSAHFWMNCP